MTEKTLTQNELDDASHCLVGPIVITHATGSPVRLPDGTKITSGHDGSVTVNEPDSSKHTFTLTVEIDPNWVEYLTVYPDIFGAACGYWLRGVAFDEERGWLVWEDDEKCRFGQEPNLEEALEAWRNGSVLPSHWFRLDRAAALKAWEEGVKKWGVDWYEQTDARREDVVVQLALLGEVRYG